MPLAMPIFLAYGDTSAWEIVVWLVAGVIGIIGQMAANKKKKEQQARLARSAPREPPPAAPTGGGASPTPNELAEIFKRLGADIPGTPPPAPRPAPSPAPPASTPRPSYGSASARQMTRKPAPQIPVRKPAAARILPQLAQRLAKAKTEADAAGREAEAERIAINAIVHGVQSRAGETRALDTATRHTGAILPRLYAMSMRLAPLPVVPMPGLDRTHHVNLPMRSRLHTRREVRDALIAQTFLSPAKSISP